MSRRLGRRRQMFRPTSAAAVLSIVAATCMVFGLSFDDRVLLAASTAMIFALLLSGVLTMVQWLVFAPSLVGTLDDFNPRFRLDIRRGGLLRRLLLPRDMPLAEQWVQLDHRGRIVARFHATLPRTRGLFRLESLMVTWSDPFGLWKARKNIARSGDEMVLLPDVGYAADRMAKLPSTLSAGDHQSMNGVRNYEYGDSPRMIAWKYTAHRGELMTRESMQEQSAETLWLLDPADADLESCVIELLAHLHASMPRADAMMYSDGTGIYRETMPILRQLAAVHHPRSADVEAPVPWASLPDVIRNFRDNTIPHPAISMVSTSPEDDVATMMASSGQRSGYRILHPESAPDAEVIALSDMDDEGHAPAPVGRRSAEYGSQLSGDMKAAPSSGDLSDNRPPSERRPSERRFDVVKTLTTIACLGVLAWVTIRTMGGVFEGQEAWWPYFLSGGFAVIAIDVGRCMRSRAQSLVRAFICCAAVMLLALLTVMIRVHQVRGYWLFIPHTQQVTVSAREVAEDWEPVTTTLWDVMVRGFSHVYAQYPPVDVNVEADALIIVAAAVLMVLMRIMLVQFRCAPAVALMSAVLMATTYQVTGEATQTTSIALVILAGVVLLWSTSAIRIAFPAPMLLSTAVAALSIAVLAPMLVVAQAVSIPIVPNTGLFSSGTINPMVDLKRGLQEGSNATALTYRAPAAVYTRLSTLDSFDGDTWSFGTPVSVGLNRSSSYGGDFTQVGDGYLLGGGDADILWVTPLMKYLVANDSNDASQRFIRSSQDSDRYVLDATITINALRTRYLPVSGEVLLYSGDARDGNWHRNVDGAYRSDKESTWAGMRYRVQSLYIKPVGNIADFDSIDELQQTIAKRKVWLAANADTLDGSSGSSESLATMDPRIGDDTGTGRRLSPIYGTLPMALPSSVRSVISQARRQGVPTDGADAASQLAAMKYLVDYFKQPDFVYSLNEPDGNGRDNMTMVGEFLRSKSGYCVHYASALAVLGRGMGLSTRMVLGYTPGQSVGDGTYAVAEKQLHAWVETYIDGIGWVPFDVTPAASDDSGTAGSTTDASSSNQSSPVQSQTPIPSTSSSSAAPSVSESGDSNTSSPSSDDSASSSQGNRDLSPLFISLGIAVVIMLAGLLLATPSLLRRRRRRRRYRLLDAALASDSGTQSGTCAADETAAGIRTPEGRRGDDIVVTRVWSALWREIVDTAIDAGLDFPDTLSDIAFARELSDLLDADETDGAEHARLLLAIAGGAVQGTFSTGTGASDEGGGVKRLSDDEHAAGAVSVDQTSGVQTSAAHTSGPLPSREDVEVLLGRITSRLLHRHSWATTGFFRIRAWLLPKSLFR
ncbi:MAG: transglutaminaseTgpA domain-containing protein [Bifidobacterium crudilactis]|jgi:hypothetical protein